MKKPQVGRKSQSQRVQGAKKASPEPGVPRVGHNGGAHSGRERDLTPTLMSTEGTSRRQGKGAQADRAALGSREGSEGPAGGRGASGEPATPSPNDREFTCSRRPRIHRRDVEVLRSGSRWGLERQSPSLGARRADGEVGAALTRPSPLPECQRGTYRRPAGAAGNLNPEPVGSDDSTGGSSAEEDEDSGDSSSGNGDVEDSGGRTVGSQGTREKKGAGGSHRRENGGQHREGTPSHEAGKGKRAKESSGLSLEDIAALLASMERLAEERAKNIIKTLDNKMDEKINKFDKKNGQENGKAGGGIRGRVEERLGVSEEKVARLEGEVNMLAKDREEVRNKLDFLENYTRRCNIKIVGLKEEVEGGSLVGFLEKWVPEVLGEEAVGAPIHIERAARAPIPKPGPGQRPRSIIAKLHTFQDRERVLGAAAKGAMRRGTPLEYKGQKVFFYPDISAALLKRRKEFEPVKRQIKSKGYDCILRHPATLKVTLPGGEKRFISDVEKARQFGDNLPSLKAQQNGQ